MTPTLFNVALSFMDWTPIRKTGEGKDNEKKVRSRAAKQGWKTRRYLGEFEKLVSNAGRTP